MLKIGSLNLKNRFILAPLAGYSDLPFRILCRRMGAGLCVSEMISCHGLAFGQEKTVTMTASVKEERPVSFQLFGADPEIMGQATKLLAETKPDLIDINMGCPVKKVTKRGAGAALMSTPDLARKVIDAVVENSQCPVTVKIRAGVNSSSLSAVSFGKMIESAGAAAVAVHGRTWAQGFGGQADWHVIQEVKEALSIPVIGNGDIQTHAEGLARMQQTGCDGVMIGRGAMGNPWVFSSAGRPNTLSAIAVVMNEHLNLMEQFLPVDRMLGCIKNHLGRYLKGVRGAAVMRKQIYSCPDFTHVKNSIKEMENSPAV